MSEFGSLQQVTRFNKFRDGVIGQTNRARPESFNRAVIRHGEHAIFCVNVSVLLVLSSQLQFVTLFGNAGGLVH
jgi:hypothetical protein